MSSKPVPHSIEAEQATLGAILINPSAITDVMGVVKASDFYIQRNAWIWETILRLDEEGRPIDYLLIVEELEKADQLKKIGGSAYLTKLMTEVPSSLHAKHYAKVIADSAQRRRMLKIAQELATTAYDEDKPLSVGELTEEIFTTISSNDKGAEQWSEAVDDFSVDLGERIATPFKEVWGLSYGNGFTSLNRVTGGAQQSELAIIAGPPGEGKSIVVGDWVSSWSQKALGAVYSLEMPANVWIRRQVSRLSGVAVMDMLKGQLDAEQQRSILEVTKVLKARGIFLSDHEDWTSDEIRADLTRLKHKHNIKWAVIDYLGLLSDVTDDDIEKSKVVTQRIRKTCRALDIHILGVSSVNKMGMGGGVPTMANVSGSGRVLHEADVVYWMNEFIPMSANDKEAFKALSPQEKSDVTNSMRTFFILKGRHLVNSNLSKHLCFAKNRPTLAEATFPQEVQLPPMKVPYKDD